MENIASDSIAVCICCYWNMFTKPLPSNSKHNTHTGTQGKWLTTEELLAAFSLQSIPKLYKQDKVQLSGIRGQYTDSKVIS
jgi:hypothetical protein